MVMESKDVRGNLYLVYIAGYPEMSEGRRHVYLLSQFLSLDHPLLRLVVLNLVP